MDAKQIKVYTDVTKMNPQDIHTYYNINIVHQFFNAKSEHPNDTKRQLCKRMGISESTLLRIMKDNDIQSPYRYRVPINKNKNKKTIKSNEGNITSTQKRGKSKIIKAGGIDDSDYNKFCENIENDLKR